MASGTFQLSLSTTSAAVGSLDTSSLDNNLGSDNQLFSTVVLAGGAAPMALAFSGTPFDYDPADGNLLLDIQVVDFFHPCTNPGALEPECAFYDARAGLAPGAFSRAQDWTSSGGATADNAGLVTTFLIPEPSTFALLLAGLVFLSRASGRHQPRARTNIRPPSNGFRMADGQDGHWSGEQSCERRCLYGSA